MRGCAPLWRRMSIVSAARFTPRKAASTTSSGDPTNVTTVRLVASPGSTSSSRIPSTDPIGNLPNHGRIAAFAEIGYALYDSLHHNEFLKKKVSSSAAAGASPRRPRFIQI